MLPLLKFKDIFIKEKFCLGLDIGSSSIKLVKLRFLKEKTELCGYNLEVLQDNLTSVLKNITESYDTKKLNLSVCGPAAIIRYVNFPRMNNAELRQALKFEAQKHIPFPISEVNIDGYILKEDLSDNRMLVVLAAVKKEFIEQRLKLIQDLGLKANIVDIDSVALINAFNFNYSQDTALKTKTVALLNIGAHLTNLNILEDGLPHLSRDIYIAGDNFTQKLQDTLGLDFRAAESLKISPDKEKLAQIMTAIESVLSNLVHEVRVSFDYYESQTTSSVGKIFLSGGGSKLPAIKDMLAKLLGIEVEYWDPLRQIDVSNGIDRQNINVLSSQLAVAVGLALRQ